MVEIIDDGPSPDVRMVKAFLSSECLTNEFWLDIDVWGRRVFVWLRGDISPLPEFRFGPGGDEFWELCRTCPDIAVLLDWILEHAETDEQKKLAALIEQNLLGESLA